MDRFLVFLFIASTLSQCTPRHIYQLQILEDDDDIYWINSSPIAQKSSDSVNVDIY